ncbi:MAG: NAD(P)-dependent oxidoreductase [Rhizobiaceae bacterium]|nr:NAD(P)-dependent oxidoreductase [Rhizobiaceae bacterium]
MTGATGFVGRAVARRFADGGSEVLALYRSASRQPCADGVPAAGVDFSDRAQLAETMAAFRPDAVIHAAGRVPGGAEEDDWSLFDANLGLTTRVVEATRQAAPGARLVVIGSAAQYGAATPAGRGTREDDPLQPVGCYGASKAAALIAALAAARKHGLDVVAAVPFNLIGADQSEHLVPATFANAALRNPGQVIAVGDVRAQRDFLDISDAAAAVEAIALRGRRLASYNIGSGRPTTIGRVLEIVSGSLEGGLRWQPRPPRSGAQTVSVSYADIGLIEAHTGWRPAIAIEDAVARMVEELRDRLARRPGRKAGQ